MVNPSVTSDKKAALIVQTGPMKTMKTSKLKVEKKHETRSSIQKLTTTQDGTEIESDYEELEFDDASAVDYDLDYTHSV